MYSIEQNIPIPQMRHGGSQFPLSELAVGESFFVPGGDDIVKARAKLTAAIANHYRRKKSARRFTVQTQIEDGVKGMRVWCLSGAPAMEENED
jgi:hypothetical protein